MKVDAYHVLLVDGVNVADMDTLLKQNTMPPIVTLCGSTKFKEDFLNLNKILTLEGAIVLMPGVFAHSGDEITDQDKRNLDKLHKRKISMSDFIIIVDKDGYYGQSTASEIGFAQALGIPIYYYSQMGDKK